MAGKKRAILTSVLVVRAIVMLALGLCFLVSGTGRSLLGNLLATSWLIGAVVTLNWVRANRSAPKARLSAFAGFVGLTVAVVMLTRSFYADALPVDLALAILGITAFVTGAFRLMGAFHDDQAGERSRLPQRIALGSTEVVVGVVFVAVDELQGAVSCRPVSLPSSRARSCCWTPWPSVDPIPPGEKPLRGMSRHIEGDSIAVAMEPRARRSRDRRREREEGMSREPSSGAVGWTVFAGIMMVLIGSFHAIGGLVGILEDDFYAVTRNYVFQFDATTWGWIHLVGGLIVVLAGFGVFKGAVWARTVGVIVVALSAIANFAWIPGTPSGASPCSRSTSPSSGR
jgi:hypothetical protein